MIMMMTVMMTITINTMMIAFAIILPLQSSDMQTEPPPRANFCETVNQLDADDDFYVDGHLSNSKYKQQLCVKLK